MKLSELNPRLVHSQLWPGVEELSFDCPKCGAPYRIVIHVRDGPPDLHNHIWQRQQPTNTEMTIVPTIINQRHGRKSCGWQGNIIRGQVRTQNQ